MYRITEADFFKITWRTTDDNEDHTLLVSVTANDVTILDVGLIINQEIPDGGFVTAITDIGLGFTIAPAPDYSEGKFLKGVCTCGSFSSIVSDHSQDCDIFTAWPHLRGVGKPSGLSL